MAGSVPDEFIDGTHVRRDWVDLRDQPYLPSLSVLRQNVSLDHRLLVAIQNTNLKEPIFGVRDQKQTQRCVGYALAALIDVQRCLQLLRRPVRQTLPNDKVEQIRKDIASADMLYRMAYFHDRYPDPDDDQGVEGIRSLRSAVKGFYHHGACLDWPENKRPTDTGRWQSTCYFPVNPDDARLFPTIDQAKEARKISLGAYFRLASVLNHYHSALNDAEAILTTANIHDGWRMATPESGGEIAWPPPTGKTGSHAVVLTGYDETGFHVLNSWGAGWGGYRGQAGIGLWHYADWAQNVIDSWVLRLGVSAPEAFEFSTGEKGVKGLYGAAQAGSTPCLELVGHYMHLDDGCHVTTGSYPSFPSGWSTTCKYLEEVLDPEADPLEPGQKKYRGLLVWIPGSFEGIKPAFAAAVARKARIKGLGLYPYTVFWCNSFVEQSLEVLDIIFESCKAQAGADAEHLDSLIEERMQGVGRAFWREIETSAHRAVWGTGELPQEHETQGDPKRFEPGYVAGMLTALVKQKDATGCELHLVAEGAGALVVHEMLAFAEGQLDADVGELFASVHLAHPAIGLPRAERRLVPLMQAMNGASDGKTNRARQPGTPHVEPLVETGLAAKARIYVPTTGLEEVLCFGDYGKSLLHLVSRSFEDRRRAPRAEDPDRTGNGEPQLFLGMADIARQRSFRARTAIHRLNGVSSQTRPGDRVTQTELIRDPTVPESIFKAIASMHDPADRRSGGGKDGEDHR